MPNSNSKPCKVTECEKIVSAWGYCPMHYRRVKVHGTTERVIRTVEDRFWAKVEKTEDCWIWRGKKGLTGYGSIVVNGKLVYAHRLVFVLFGKALPDDMECDHLCHNTSCVRPDHLRPVTRKQNAENRSGARSGTKSGVRGVDWAKSPGKWRARVGHNRKQYCAGYFDDIEAAGAAAQALRKQLFSTSY